MGKLDKHSGPFLSLTELTLFAKIEFHLMQVSISLLLRMYTHFGLNLLFEIMTLRNVNIIVFQIIFAD